MPKRSLDELEQGFYHEFNVLNFTDRSLQKQINIMKKTHAIKIKDINVENLSDIKSKLGDAKKYLNVVKKELNNDEESKNKVDELEKVIGKCEKKFEIFIKPSSSNDINNAYISHLSDDQLITMLYNKLNKVSALRYSKDVCKNTIYTYQTEYMRENSDKTAVNAYMKLEKIYEELNGLKDEISPIILEFINRGGEISEDLGKEINMCIRTFGAEDDIKEKLYNGLLIRFENQGLNPNEAKQRIKKLQKQILEEGKVQSSIAAQTRENQMPTGGVSDFQLDTILDLKKNNNPTSSNPVDAQRLAKGQKTDNNPANYIQDYGCINNEDLSRLDNKQLKTMLEDKCNIVLDSRGNMGDLRRTLNIYKSNAMGFKADKTAVKLYMELEEKDEVMDGLKNDISAILLEFNNRKVKLEKDLKNLISKCKRAFGAVEKNKEKSSKRLVSRFKNKGLITKVEYEQRIENLKKEISEQGNVQSSEPDNQRPAKRRKLSKRDELKIATKNISLLVQAIELEPKYQRPYPQEGDMYKESFMSDPTKKVNSISSPKQQGLG